MTERRKTIVGNPHEESLTKKLKERRMAVIKQKANQDFEDKKVSESLYTSYEIANISSYLINLFSAVTGSFAGFYLLHTQFGEELPMILIYTISIFFGMTGAILLDYAKRQNLSLLFPNGFKHKNWKWRSILTQIFLSGASIALTFYACSVFPSFMNEVDGLENLSLIEREYKTNLDSIEAQISLVTSGLTYNSGGKKGEIKTGAAKLLGQLHKNKASLFQAQKEDLAGARIRNKERAESHETSQTNKGYLLGWISVFLELLIFPFCLGFYYWYEYLVSQEDEQPSIPRMGHQDLEMLVQTERNNAPKNETGNGFFFRNSKEEANTQLPVYTESYTGCKYAIVHERNDGEKVEMNKDQLASRIREYTHRVSAKIAEIQKKGYSSKRGSELSNRFHQLDYWTRKQRDLLNIYDESLERI